MAVLTDQDVVELHKEKFGQYPVITGIRFNGSGDTIDRIIDAIASGVPYIEQPPPKGVDV